MVRTTRNGVSAAISPASPVAQRRHADDVAIALPLVDVGLAQRGDAVGQHRARVGIDDAGGIATAVIVGGGDLVEALFEEQARPVLQPIGVDAAGVFGVQRGQAEQRFGVASRHRPMCARYAFQKPRTEASVARVSCVSAPAPPISITDSSSAAAAMPRCTKPPTAPSSIDT